MSDTRQRDAAVGERLSALLDAELGSSEVDAACRHWQAQAEVRADWHAWHVIGDVLRSEDLAATAAGDAAFLSRLRMRLAEEPVILAPQPLQAPVVPQVDDLPQVAAAAVPRRWAQWGTPTAVAAGFMLVVGVFVSLPRDITSLPTATVADARPMSPVLGGASAVPALAQGLAAGSAPEQAFLPNGALVRDSQLDGYLAAHQQFSGSTALGEPAGFMRVVTHEAAGRR